MRLVDMVGERRLYGELGELVWRLGGSRLVMERPRVEEKGRGRGEVCRRGGSDDGLVGGGWVGT